MECHRNFGSHLCERWSCEDQSEVEALVDTLEVVKTSTGVTIELPIEPFRGGVEARLMSGFFFAGLFWVSSGSSRPLRYLRHVAFWASVMPASLASESLSSLSITVSLYFLHCSSSKSICSVTINLAGGFLSRLSPSSSSSSSSVIVIINQSGWRDDFDSIVSSSLSEKATFILSSLAWASVMIWSFLSHHFCFVSSSLFAKAAKWLVEFVVVTGEKWNSCSGSE